MAAPKWLRESDCITVPFLIDVLEIGKKTSAVSSFADDS